MGILRLHHISYNLDQLEKDGCQLCKPEELFRALMIATSCDPCTTGCAYFKDGKCPAYLLHHSVPDEQRHQAIADKRKNSSDQSGLIGGRWRGMTSKQIQIAEGISPNEFQKRKQAGKYKE